VKKESETIRCGKGGANLVPLSKVERGQRPLSFGSKKGRHVSGEKIKKEKTPRCLLGEVSSGDGEEERKPKKSNKKNRY